MPDKKIYLYDSSNAALLVKGIRVELYDAVTKSYLDGADSDDLNPGASPPTWGVVLNFPSGANPVDVLVSDPTYQYPGNTLRYLNGDLADEVFMDLLHLPGGPGGQPVPRAPLTIPQINRWVDASSHWDTAEREAVRGLIFNYAHIIAPEQFGELAGVAGNWGAALLRVGFPPHLLSDFKPWLGTTGGAPVFRYEGA